MIFDGSSYEGVRTTDFENDDTHESSERRVELLGDDLDFVADALSRRYEEMKNMHESLRLALNEGLSKNRHLDEDRLYDSEIAMRKLKQVLAKLLPPDRMIH